MRGFTYERADSLAKAVATAAHIKGAKFIAGGTNLVDLMKLQVETPTHLIDINDLGLDKSKVNRIGGAIALGHPLGATGAIRAATVVHALRRHQLKYGMVTMCVGTGMGAAGILERM